MKVLVYGFGPYLHHKDNVTIHVLNKIKVDKDVNLKKIIFPVKYYRNMFLKEVRKFNPDLIIGTGQCAKGKKIRIERRAINIIGSKKEKTKIMYRKKPKFVFVNLRLKKDQYSRLSYNKADGYVCNYSMYNIIDYCIKTKRKFAFVHIPKDFDVLLASSFMNKKIKEITKE